MDLYLEEYQRYFNRLNDLFPPLLYSFLGLISSVVVLWHNLDHMSDQFHTTFNDNSPQRFDYIVVGAGSSGAILASNLAKSHHVLLLEAGGEPNPLTYIPAMTWTMRNQPYVDWQFKSIPQENACLGMKNNQCTWSHGKGLGGSSNLNTMTYSRGHPKDYDNWASVAKDPRWAYDNLVPYFRKSEDYAEDVDVDNLIYGIEGRSRIAHPPFSGMTGKFLAAVADVGYNTVDLNGPFTEGFSRVPYVQQANGRRLSTHHAYLLEEMDNPKLTVFKYSEVVKILFKSDKEAYGVEFTRHGMSKFAFARKEVILSAGAIGNAKILMLSGVGPRSHLDYLNISTISDLPVGDNLQGHVGTFIGPFIVNETVTMNADRDVSPAAVHEFAANGTGPLSSTGTEVTGFLMSSMSRTSFNESQTWPDLELVMYGNAVHEKMPNVYTQAFNAKAGVLEKFLDLAKDEDSFQILTLLGRPRSRGRVRLQSSDPQDLPVIDPNFFDHPDDVKILMEGVKKGVTIAEESKTFQGLDSELMEKSFPGCEKFDLRSDEYWECYIKHYTIVMHSPVGTCAMGPEDSKSAVVDPKLRVLGTKSLRIVDVSVIPNIISGSTYAASMMIAQVGTDLILEHQLKHELKPR